MGKKTEDIRKPEPAGNSGNGAPPGGDAGPKKGKIDNKFYEAELAKLQVELVKLQEWIRHQGLKVVVIFEGRDTAGKGGVINRITRCLSPRVCRMVALTAPTERPLCKSHMFVS